MSGLGKQRGFKDPGEPQPGGQEGETHKRQLEEPRHHEAQLSSLPASRWPGSLQAPAYHTCGPEWLLGYLKQCQVPVVVFVSSGSLQGTKKRAVLSVVAMSCGERRTESGPPPESSGCSAAGSRQASPQNIVSVEPCGSRGEQAGPQSPHQVPPASLKSPLWLSGQRPKRSAPFPPAQGTGAKAPGTLAGGPRTC